MRVSAAITIKIPFIFFSLCFKFQFCVYFVDVCTFLFVDTRFCKSILSPSYGIVDCCKI